MTEQRISGNLVYRESLEGLPGRKRRICALHEEGNEKPVSRLSLVSLHTRFGEKAIAAEGLGGIQTLPQHRGKGYATTLMERALSSISERANAAFLYGIEGLYGKFGFASCLRESSLTMWTGRTKAADSQGGLSVRAAVPGELSEIIELYNTAHQFRPWTAVRTAKQVERISYQTPWHPAPEVIIVGRRSRITGYAAIGGKNYGDTKRNFTVLEAAVVDYESGEVLLSEIGRRCGAQDLSEFSILEPSDGILGKAAFRLGASEKSESSPDGGGMAAVLNREALINELSSELKRRIAEARRWLGVPPENSHTDFRDIIERIASADVIPSDTDLVRLLLGYWRWEDAKAEGFGAPAADAAILRAMFPGGGVPWLAVPYSHRFDRY
jgi:hypothetical protein